MQRDQDELLTYEQAAHLLNMTPNTIKQMVYWKQLPAEPLPGYKRRKGIRRSEVRRYEDKRTGASAYGRRVILPDEEEAQAHARLLGASMMWAMDTDGDTGTRLIRDAREQAAILSKSEAGRAKLAEIWQQLGSLLADFGGSPAFPERMRARVEYFRGMIQADMPSPDPHDIEPEPETPSALHAPAPKRRAGKVRV